MLQSLLSRWFVKPLSEEEFKRERKRIIAAAPTPLFWMFGKTGSGKTSIIRFITKAPAAEIGGGFKPQTRYSAIYDFPSFEQPVFRFLDTRGLGEIHYDPAEDLAEFSRTTHVIVVVCKVMDHAQADIIAALRSIDQAHPHRKVVLALTSLHEAYPGQQHPAPDPYEGELTPASISDELRRSIELHRERFGDLVDRIVPIDLTQPEDGFDEPNFGGERLIRTLIDLLPAGYRQGLIQMESASDFLKTELERKAAPYILGYSIAAATASAVPVPWVDIPVVLGFQTHLVYRIADLYGQRFNTQMLLQLAGVVSGQMLARLAVRAPLKLIPVLGYAASAALAFGYTYSLGLACCWYFSEYQQGHIPSEAELKEVWNEKLNLAQEIWKRTQAK